MATKRMLVDATHPEETRVVVTSGNRLDEFDFESATRRQLRGNIYLAKVTRVEPSLQAAFVEYGGNRHGFLAFSEIHPDYYQIPVADREALLHDEQAADRAEADTPEPDTITSKAEEPEAEDDSSEDGGHVEDVRGGDESVENVGGGDALEEVPERRRTPARKYKIQEVIKRRQVMLVQVVKEERGNKGAALTTYLSLAGRYSVLMPNTARGGGISRKITNATDRKRLKEIAGELEVPNGMGVILRTAGASRTKAEVKRDFEYLMRLWENVRTLTLQSTAPCLVYEEGSLIKRSIRDLYNKDIDEVLVSGDAAYREAKEFMRMIMPSHSKNVQPYKEPQPIFSRYSVEAQLDSMFSPQVTLPSGGYIVINPTEALVSIDVNSGRATKEHNIEDTALQTNLEAAEEVARQLRLRDLAGLIVIDFIDMEEKRSNRLVERKLKDCLKNDRARIQVGRISHFGLLEMSRQRIRFGVLEGSTHSCPTCHGTGLIRSVESVSLMVMRAIEDHVLRKPGASINVRVPTEVALYILNAKRNSLTEIETNYNLSITLTADPKLVGSHYAIERGEARGVPAEVAARHVSVDSADMVEIEEEVEITETAEAEESSEKSPRRRRRRRRRGGASDDAGPQVAQGSADAETTDAEADGDEEESEAPGPRASDDEDGNGRRRRRRGRRGGRRNRRTEDGVEIAAESEEAGSAAEAAPEAEPPEGLAEPAQEPFEGPEEVVAPVQAGEESVSEAAPVEEAPPAKPKRTRKKKAAPAEEPLAEVAEAAPAPKEAEPVAAAKEPPAAIAEEKDNGTRRAKRGKKELPPDEIVVTSTATEKPEGKTDKPKRGGWWQKGFFG
ncbi:MAG TPA: ribonuclease E/G [Devosiaceae bacterium]